FSNSLAGGAERQLELKPFFFLEMLNHFKEITGLRIAAWTEHPHEAFCRPFGSSTQLLEPDRCVDIVAKDRLSGIEIPGEKAFDAFLQELLPVFPIGSEACLHRFLELARQRHFTSPASCASCSPPSASGQSQCRGPGAFSSRRRAR